MLNFCTFWKHWSWKLLGFSILKIICTSQLWYLFQLQKEFLYDISRSCSYITTFIHINEHRDPSKMKNHFKIGEKYNNTHNLSLQENHFLTSYFNFNITAVSPHNADLAFPLTKTETPKVALRTVDSHFWICAISASIGMSECILIKRQLYAMAFGHLRTFGIEF